LSGTISASSGIRFNSAGSSQKAWNNIIYDFSTASYSDAGILIQNTTGTSELYNNTIQNSKYGLIVPSIAITIAKNNLMSSCATAANGNFAAGTDYNATDNASMAYTVTGGGNIHDRLSQTFTFFNEGTDDFRLASGDAGAKDFGVTDPGGGLFSADIIGTSRPVGSAWDIGAYEAAAAGAATHPGWTGKHGWF